MKNLFFIPSKCGGAERVACTISKILASAGHEVVYCLFGKENQLNDFLLAKAKVHWFKSEKFTDGMIVIMRRTIREELPDYVYGSQSPINWRLVLAVLTSKKRPKIILRNEIDMYARGFFQKLHMGLTYPFAKAVIAQTDEMRNGLIKELHLKPQKVLTIANPVDRDLIDLKLKDGNPYPPDENDTVTFVSVGRFGPEKGFDLLIKAFVRIKSVIQGARLYIVGEINEKNPYYVQITDLVSKFRMQDSVVFPGFKKNPYVYMHYADCYVLSSRNEGLPNVMLESLYCGTPVAAFKCIPVIERIVEEGVTGFLAEKENIEGLAEAMLRASRLGRVTSSHIAANDKKFVDLFQ